jgi:hypothetical protein
VRSVHETLSSFAPEARHQELEAIAQSYKRTTGFDPESHNGRPSRGVEPRSRRRDTNRAVKSA